LIGTWLLSAKLNTGETEYGTPVGFFLQCTQTCVLGGEASLTGDVNHQANLPFVLFEIQRLAGDRCHFQIVKVRHESVAFVLEAFSA